MGLPTASPPVADPRPRGRTSRGRPTLEDLQRARLLVAAVEVVEDVGYSRLTVSRVVGRAKGSRKTFYDHFANREDCFLAALEKEVARARIVAVEAYAQEDGWRAGVRRALEGLLILMEEEPGSARMCVVEALGGGPRILKFRAEMLREVALGLDEGRALTTSSPEPPAITADAVAGGIFSVLHNRLCQPTKEPLTDLLGALMCMITMPYLGARAARMELRKPCRRAARAKGSGAAISHVDPSQQLSIRLTYRTLRTLMVIAERPGSSNHAVALGAGVSDQGQISKLLARLAGLNLIENTGLGQARGAANAWQLTELGARLLKGAWPL